MSRTLRLIDAEGAFAAVARAAELAQRGKIDALINGGLHICELLAVVVGQTGVQPDGRITHCLVMDLSGDRDPLVIMTAASNTAPTPDEIAGITQNAIDLAGAMKFHDVRVAILSTMQTVNARVPRTVHASARPKPIGFGEMEDAFDQAPLMQCDAERVPTPAIDYAAWPDAKRANVLVVADLGVANLLVQSLSLLLDAHAAAIVLGACVSIVAINRVGSSLSNRASCAVASLLAEARRQKVQPAAANWMQSQGQEPPCGDRSHTCAVRRTTDERQERSLIN